jgi:hypothetical protein
MIKKNEKKLNYCDNIDKIKRDIASIIRKIEKIIKKNEIILKR